MREPLWIVPVLVLIAVIGAPNAQANILCGGTPTSISAINAGGGCQYGTNLFTNVSIVTSSESTNTNRDAIDPTKVQIAFTGAIANPGVVNLTMSNSDLASWALTGTMQFDLNLTYTVTGSAPYFSAIADSFNGSGTGALLFNESANGQTLTALSLVMMSQGPVALTGGPISTFTVVDNIQVHALNGSATLVSTTDSFTMGSSTVATPEPPSSALLGFGLLASAFLWRWRMRSAARRGA